MTHPVLIAAADMRAALKGVADINPTFMSTAEKSAALIELARAAGQADELRLRILAASADVAEPTAARDAGAWFAGATRCGHDEARADLRLALGLERRYELLATAMREGRTNLAQARVMARALDEIPAEVPSEIVLRAEQTLVKHAEDFGPRELGRLGRRIVDVVAPEMADAVEGRRLAALESRARSATRLRVRSQGDGTSRIWGVLPDAVGARLLTYLEAFTSPRRDPSVEAEGGTCAEPVTRAVLRPAYPRRLGRAFCQLLEAVDPRRLPLHAGDATTVIVTISLDSLREELGAAELLSGRDLPGEDAASRRLSAAAARRLACGAAIVPAVLGGGSEVLDLGRTRRLFSAAQRRALLLRDRRCRAEGCDVPGTWVEAHHWTAWSRGGFTDLDDGVLLCSHHHHCVHDPAFNAERLPDGDVRFRRRC